MITDHARVRVPTEWRRWLVLVATGCMAVTGVAAGWGGRPTHIQVGMALATAMLASLALVGETKKAAPGYGPRFSC